MVASLIAIVVAGGSGLQRGLGVRAPAAASPRASESGAWFCPHGGSKGWRAWIVITNPGTHPVPVRITTFGPSGVKAQRMDSVPGGTQIYRSVRATAGGEATWVEYFGGWVGAGWVVQTSADGTFLGGSRCADSPSRTWYLTDVPTARGESSWLAVMNPFGEDATVDVVIRTDRRAAVRPGPLSPYVVPARTSSEIRLNRYLLQAPGERIVSAEVKVQLGRIAAAAITLSTDGMATEIGEPGQSSRWFLPGVGFRGGSNLSLLNGGSRRSDLAVLAQSATGQRALTGVDGLALSKGEIEALPISDETATGLSVGSTNKAAVVAERRLAGINGETALIGGADAPKEQWLLLPTLPPKGGRALLVVQNPGPEPAEAELRLLSASGPLVAGSRSIIVPAGRAVTIDLTRAGGTQPVSALVSAAAGTVVVGGASYAADGAGYAATLAVPLGG